MKNKQFKQYPSVVIDSTTIEGKGVARIEEKVVFVKKAVAGDVCDIQMRKSHKRHAEADIIALKESSKLRRDPHCNYFSLCGGCSLQHIDYAHQKSIKEKHVKDALDRIGKVVYDEFRPIIGSDQTEYYRNKLDFAFSSKRWLTVEEIQSLPENADRTGVGFHLSGMFDKVLDIDYCYHQDTRSNEIRNFIRSKSKELQIPYYDVRSHEGVLRNLIIRNTSIGEWMIVLCFTDYNDAIKQLLASIKESFGYLTSIMFAVNTKLNDVIYDLDIQVYSGREYIQEKLGDYTFNIRPKSFFQTNSAQAAILYEQVAEIAQISPLALVYDLYTGVGSIAIYIAKYAKKVIGIELIEEAIRDAQENALINQVQNVQFYASDMKNMLNADFVENHGKPQVIITDPPRAGMDEAVVRELLRIECPKIVYVSCNPTTQARDLALLQEKYSIKTIQPVDMFPHTAHVESIALLVLKQ